VNAVADPAALCPDPLAGALASSAFNAIQRVYVPERHQIAAAVATADGRTFLGLHLDAMVGRAAVCAEAAAVAAARLETRSPLVAIATVRYPKPTEEPEARIVPPCGLCRELLIDHGAPEMTAAVVIGGTGVLVPLRDLLPHKYVGSKWSPSPGARRPR
jgi:cytidine deaminase